MTRRVVIPYRYEKKLKKYTDALEAVGLEPAPLVLSRKPDLDGAHGLLLMGGTDLNPKLYGAAPEPETQTPDDERDAFELEILDCALRADMPVLAICRGVQVLNVYAGGTLIQHLASPRHDAPENTAFAHEVDIEPGSLLSSIAGVPRWRVNSYHHQAAARPGANLRISARDAGDGTIEALENSERTFVLGVQWHPEDLAIRAQRAPRRPSHISSAADALCAGSSQSLEQLTLFQQFAKRIHTS